MLKINLLQINHRDKPINIDTVNPSFNWSFISDKKDTFQTAYQIQIGCDGENIYDTGKVLSEQSIGVKYNGKKLTSHSHYEVTLTVWTSTESAVISSYFETAFLDNSQWEAKWIYPEEQEAIGLPVFTRRIDISGAVKSARVYCTAKGVYDIQINKCRIQNDYLRPGWTNYRKRHQYQTYNVKEYIDKETLIEITVAPGWYVGNYGADGISNHYGKQLAAVLELHINYEDGTKKIIVTDENWQCKTSKIISSEIYHGEVVDYTKTHNEFKSVRSEELDTSILVSEESAPVRLIETLDAVQLIHTPKGEVVIDFGQNIAGIVQFKATTVQGQTIKIRHAEVLDKFGNFYTDNLRSAKATEVYTCNKGTNSYKPHFTYHGFRYIAIEGLGRELNLDDFKALVLSSEMSEIATFSCSNELVNKLWSNIKWSMNGNFVDIPTDCPQRDERLGWTGDATAFVQTAGQLKDTYAFYSRWLKDLASEQTKEYGVPHVVPNILGNHGGAAVWSDSATIIPWTVYQLYGDSNILSNQYQSMKEWVETMRAGETSLHLRKNGHQYGDWLALDKEEFSSRPMGATDPYLIASIFYAYSTKILYQSAEILGFYDDEKEYKKLYEEIINGIQKEYITETGRVVTETQTACALILLFDIAKSEHVPLIKEKLISNINAHSGHLTTGFIGTPFICHALSKVGAGDVAGKLLLKEDYPSWLEEVKLGATTIWERWNSMLPDGSFDESGMNSFNHYAFGSIGSWIIERLAGIRPSSPGYKTSIIEPQLINGITYVNASRETPYGILSSNWKCLDNLITIDINIPANAMATLILPEREGSVELGSGVYHYEYSTTTKLEPSKFTMDTKISQMLENDEAKAIFDQHVTKGNAMLLRFISNKTLNQLIAMNPDNTNKEIYTELLEMLNKVS